MWGVWWCVVYVGGLFGICVVDKDGFGGGVDYWFDDFGCGRVKGCVDVDGGVFGGGGNNDG